MAAEYLSWWPLPAWISPGAALFVFLNVLVGAIAVTSRGQQHGRGRRLRRSASSMVLHRLRSFSIFSVHPAAECYYPDAEERQVGGETAPEPSVQEPAPVLMPAADAAASMSETWKDGAEAEEKATSLDEANVPVQQRDAPQSPSPAATVAAEATAAVESPGKNEPATVAPESVKRRRTGGCGRGAEEAPEGKAELNALADTFIRQFREDLKLQRLNSIINYTRTLRRRAGAALAHN